MHSSIENFTIKLIALIVLAPLVGLYMVNLANLAEKAWKTNDRKKKMGCNEHLIRNFGRISRLVSLTYK